MFLRQEGMRRGVTKKVKFEFQRQLRIREKLQGSTLRDEARQKREGQEASK